MISVCLSSSCEARANRSRDPTTARFVRLTSRGCPGCGARTTHFHGHACHHIGYHGNGCNNCGQHWCFVCRRKHGAPWSYSRNPSCPHGSSSCNDEAKVAEDSVEQRVSSLHGAGLQANAAGDYRRAYECFMAAYRLRPNGPAHILSAANMKLKMTNKVETHQKS